MKICEQKITDDRKLNLYYNNGAIEIQEYNVCENYCEYRLVYSDDYGFFGYSEDMSVDELVFTFESNHPLYNPFLNLLKEEKEIKFSSDFTDEKYDDMFYVQIIKRGNFIMLKFVNYIPSERNSMEKFEFEIKNIMFDLRSKLDERGTDIKERLYIFFEESINALINEYHQITIEEYMHSAVKTLVK